VEAHEVDCGLSATRWAHRQLHMAAMTVGKSGPEAESSGAARREVDSLWKAVKQLAVTPIKERVR
jgi:hypothetical protein